MLKLEVLQNTNRKFDTPEASLDRFLVSQALWGIRMNVCMWATGHLSRGIWVGGSGCGQQQSAPTAQDAQRRAAAAQTAGIGASAVGDTRLLGKPVAFDGRETSWRSFKFQFVAHCGAIDCRLKDLLVRGETSNIPDT